MNLLNSYKRHFLTYEFLFPVLFVLAFALITEFGIHSNLIDPWLNSIRKDLYVTIASIAGALLGFAITAISIAIAFMNQERFEIIRKSKHHHTLYQVFFAAIKYLAITTVASIIGLIIDRDNNPQHWITYISIAGVLLSVVALVRCVWVLENIVYIITIKSDDK
ncbi:MAG: hypothetical protein ACOWWR_12230 [Eubacteriales bacterium]